MKTLTILLLVIIQGCTVIKTPGGGWYGSLLQQKSLGLGFAPDGSLDRLEYNTQSDPAVEALANIAAGAAKGATP